MITKEEKTQIILPAKFSIRHCQIGIEAALYAYAVPTATEPLGSETRVNFQKLVNEIQNLEK